MTLGSRDNFSTEKSASENCIEEKGMGKQFRPGQVMALVQS